MITDKIFKSGNYEPKNFSTESKVQYGDGMNISYIDNINVMNEKCSLSISEDTHYSNNKSKELTQKCTISENIFYSTPKYTIKLISSNGERDRDAQNIPCHAFNHSK